MSSLVQIARYLPSKIFPFIGNYIILFMISANLTIADYGAYYFLISIFTAIYTFSLSVIPQLIIRYCSNINILLSPKFNQFYLITIIVSILFTIVCFYIFSINFKYIFVGVLYILTYSFIEIVLSLSRLNKSEKHYNFINITKSFVPVLFILFFIFFNFASISNIFVSYILSFLVITVFFFTNYSNKRSLQDIELGKVDFLIYYFHLSVITGCLFLNSKINLFISKFYFDKNVIGIFSFNLDFFEKFLQNITSILNITFTVSAFKLYDEKKLSKLKQFLRNNLFIYISISLPIIILFLLFYSQIFSIFNKSHFIIDTKYLFFLLFSFFFTGLGHRFSIVFLITKTTNQLAKITFISLLISVIINFFFVKYFYISGLYLTQMLSSFIWFILLIVSSRKKINFL